MSRQKEHNCNNHNNQLINWHSRFIINMIISIILVQLLALLCVRTSNQQIAFPHLTQVGNVFRYPQEDLPTLESKDLNFALGLAKLRTVLKQHCQLELGKLLEVSRMVVQGVKFNILAQTKYGQLEALVYVILFDDNSTEVLDIKFTSTKKGIVSAENTTKTSTVESMTKVNAVSINSSKPSAIGPNLTNQNLTSNSMPSQKMSPPQTNNSQTSTSIASSQTSSIEGFNLQKIATPIINQPEQPKNVPVETFKFPQLKKVCDARRKQLSQAATQPVVNTSATLAAPNSTSSKVISSNPVLPVILMQPNAVLSPKLQNVTNVVLNNVTGIQGISSKNQNQNDSSNSPIPQVINTMAGNPTFAKTGINEGINPIAAPINNVDSVSSGMASKLTNTTVINVSSLLSTDNNVKPAQVSAPAVNLRTNGSR